MVVVGGYIFGVVVKGSSRVWIDWGCLGML